MTRRRKFVLVPLGVLAALMLLLVLLFDWNWLKGLAEAQASSALGRPVEIAGDLDVDLGFTSEITVNDVRVANADWASDEPLAQVPQATVAIDLWALLGGDLVLPEVRVQDPALKLERGAEGRANWEMGGAGGGGPPSIPVIGDLTITGTTIDYVDHPSGREVMATLATIQGSAPAEGDLVLTADGTLADQPLEVEFGGGSRAALGGGGEPFPFGLTVEWGEQRFIAGGTAEDLMQGKGVISTVELRAVNLNALLALAGLPEQDLPTIELDGVIEREGQTIRVLALDARLPHSDLHGEATVELGSPPTIQADLVSRVIDISEVRRLWQDPAAADRALADAEAALEAARTDDQPAQDQGPGPELPFSFAQLPDWTADIRYRVASLQSQQLQLQDLRVHGRLENQVPYLSATGQGQLEGQPVSIDVQLGPQQGTDPSPYPVDVSMQAANNHVRAEGTIQQPVELTGIDLTLSASSEQPNRMLRLVGIDAPDIPPLDVSAELHQQEQTWRLEQFDAAVGESRLSGTLALDRSGERPLLTGDLQSERLLLDQLIPAGQQQEDGAGDDGPGLTEDGGLNLDALPDLNVDLQFRGEDVRYQAYRLQPVTLDLRIVDKVPVLRASGEGSYHDAPLTVEAQLGTEQFLENPDVPYPVDVSLEALETSASAEGTVAQPGSFTGLDVQVNLEGPTLEQLGNVVQVSLPDTPPYSLNGQLTRTGDAWALDELEGRIGDSDVSGTATLELGGERPTLTADLVSQTLDFDDLAPLIGAPPATGEGETVSAQQAQEAARAEETQGVLPDDEISVPDLKAMDARVHFRGENVNAPQIALETIELEVRLEDGVLTIDPATFEIAGGELDGKIVLDARPRPADASVDISVRRVDLRRFLQGFDIEIAGIETDQEGVGTLFGRTDFTAQGNSVQELAASADGQLALVMEGGRLNALIIEALGLDVGEVLALLFSEEGDGGGPSDSDSGQQAMVAIRCFVASFDIEGGLMQSKGIVLDTEDDRITGAGTIDLGQEQLDLRFEAQVRDASGFAAGTPIQITGSFSDPQVDVVSQELIEKGLAALGLGIVLPVVGAVLPFIETGGDVPSNCQQLIAAAEEAGGADLSDGTSGAGEDQPAAE